jgi:3-methylcrotonyl-CoA carboxylase beta subunit
MSAIKSRIDPRSAEFQANAEAMRVLVADLRAKTAQVALGGSESARKKHLDRGKLLPRERVNHLLDPGTPFLEIGPWPPMACTTTTRRRLASSPASGGFRVASA